MYKIFCKNKRKSYKNSLKNLKKIKIMEKISHDFPFHGIFKRINGDFFCFLNKYLCRLTNIVESSQKLLVSNYLRNK